MNTWGMRRTLGAIAVAAAIAGVGGAAIAAATDGGGRFEPGNMHMPGGPPTAAAPHQPATPDSLHAVYVVADASGGFATRMSQTGSVTAISPMSVTARSADGFTQTYAIDGANGAAAPSFSVGDVVTVNATRKGGAAVVDTLRPPLTPVA